MSRAASLVGSGSTLYRVFLFADSLQVDPSFWPCSVFASNGEPLQLLFGEVNQPTEPGIVEPRDVIGWAWLYALHIRSALARGRLWQALHMIDALRDRIITLACLRSRGAGYQGRGVDQLPETVLARLAETLVASANSDRLTVAFAQLVDLLTDEIHLVDSDLAARLRSTLADLVTTVLIATGA